jgi:Platelet-activating factor acetylhydrolase, isoform II
MPMVESLWKVVRRLALVLVVTVGLGLGLLLAALWFEHNAPVDLPIPTGPFAVGRIAAVWADTTRPDPFAPGPATPRELVVWIWFPARRTERSETSAYLPGPWERALAEHAGILLTHFLSRNPTKVHGHSLDRADVAPDSAMYPVVVFRSGIGALALDYSTIVEDLASHGYIVVGADAPYSTSVVVMPDGRVIHKTTPGNPGDAPLPAAEQDSILEHLIQVWTADTRFLLEGVARLNADDSSGRFTGRIDLRTVGLAGHSFGGATAAQFCHDDPRCTAGIDIDGALYGSVAREGVDQPFLFLLSDHGDEWASPACTICTNIRTAAHPHPDDKLIVTLIGAHHFSFSDQGLTMSRIVLSVISTLGGPGGLDARTGLASTNRYVRQFFDVHLRGAQRDTLYSGPLVPGARFEPR